MKNLARKGLIKLMLTPPSCMSNLEPPWLQHVAKMMRSLHGNLFHITDPFVRGVHRSQVDSPHKIPVMRRFDAFVAVKRNKIWNKQVAVIWDAMAVMWRQCDQQPHSW